MATGAPRHHRRNDQIRRQWRILVALSDRKWFSLSEIIDGLPRPNRHRRTILRDLEALAQVFPIERRDKVLHGLEQNVLSFFAEIA